MISENASSILEGVSLVAGSAGSSRLIPFSAVVTDLLALAKRVEEVAERALGALVEAVVPGVAVGVDLVARAGLVLVVSAAVAVVHGVAVGALEALGQLVAVVVTVGVDHSVSSNNLLAAGAGAVDSVAVNAVDAPGQLVVVVLAVGVHHPVLHGRGAQDASSVAEGVSLVAGSAGSSRLIPFSAVVTDLLALAKRVEEVAERALGALVEAVVPGVAVGVDLVARAGLVLVVSAAVAVVHGVAVGALEALGQLVAVVVTVGVDHSVSSNNLLAAGAGAVDSVAVNAVDAPGQLVVVVLAVGVHHPVLHGRGAQDASSVAEGVSLVAGSAGSSVGRPISALIADRSAFLGGSVIIVVVGTLGTLVGVEIPYVAVRVTSCLEGAPRSCNGHHEENEKSKSIDFGSCCCHKDSILIMRNVDLI